MAVDPARLADGGAGAAEEAARLLEAGEDVLIVTGRPEGGALPAGMAAEATAATVLYVATATGAPISTTHAISSAIVGVGATRSAKAVRWGVARSIVIAWVLTIPGAGLVAAVAYLILATFL